MQARSSVNVGLLWPAVKISNKRLLSFYVFIEDHIMSDVYTRNPRVVSHSRWTTTVVSCAGFLRCNILLIITRSSG